MSATTPTWNGTIPWEAVPYDIEFDEFGVASSTMNFQFEFTDAAAAVAKIAGEKIHPAFPWLKRTKAKISREEANFGKASITYAGIPPETDERTYKLKSSLATEAIQTHKDFQTWIDEGLVTYDTAEGAKKAELIWTQAGIDANFQGTESFLSPSQVYEETWVRGRSGSARDFSKLGKKMNVPPSDVKPGNIGSARNFLFLGGDIELIGYGSKMTRRWRLSGPNGWNEKIY